MVEKLKSILEYLDSVTAGDQRNYIKSFSQQLSLTGYLSEKQLLTVESIIRNHLYSLKKVAQFEMSLAKVMNSPRGQMILKLVN